jgi:hypothetical protein
MSELSTTGCGRVVPRITPFPPPAKALGWTATTMHMHVHKVMLCGERTGKAVSAQRYLCHICMWDDLESMECSAMRDILLPRE